MRKLLIALALAAACVAAATTYYLNSAGSDTAPYDTAEKGATDLATLIGLAAASGDEIRVVPGTYSPTAAIGGGTKNVTIRSWDASGGLDATNTVFDGASYTPGVTYLTFGARDASSTGPTIKGLTFRNFAAGAISYSRSNDARIEDCLFEKNGGSTAMNGGALAFTNNCFKAVVARSHFERNSVTNCGGAVYLTSSANDLNATFSDCTFVSNGLALAHNGGAIWSYRPICVEGCRFKGNMTRVDSTVGEDSSGGAIYIGYGHELAHVTGCLFTGEAQAKYGRCITFQGGVMASNCVFGGVSSVNSSHGMICFSGATIVDCVFTNCVLNNKLFHSQGSGSRNSYIRNCLVAGNTPTTCCMMNSYAAGGTTGIFFENCTILFPGAPLYDSPSSGHPTYTFRNCAILGTVPATSTATAVFENCTDRSATVASLGFVDAEYGDYRPRSDSPLVDGGQSLDWHAGALDLGGRSRVVYTVDIGCYERQTTDLDYTVLRAVATAAEKTGEWADAHVGLESAFGALVRNTTRLFVKSGTYRIGSTLQVVNRSVTVVSCGADGQIDRDGTILDGQGARRILYAVTSALDANGIPTADRRVTFEGFTFTNGVTALNDGQVEAGKGGGVYLVGRAQAAGKTPSQFVNCRFTGCKASYGGGIAMEGGEMVDCVFDNNVADIDEDITAQGFIGGQGGAVGVLSIVDSSKTAYDRSATWFAPGFIGCTFSNNTAEASGGAISACWRRASSSQANRTMPVYVADSLFVTNTITWPDSKYTKGTSTADLRDQANGSVISHLSYGLVTNCVFRRCGSSSISYGLFQPSTSARAVDCDFFDGRGRYGMFYGTAATIVFDRCRFVDGYDQIRCTGTFRNCLFATTRTARLVQINGSKTDFDNCTFISPGSTTMIYYPSGPYAVNFSNSIVYRTPGAVLFDKRYLCTNYFNNCCLYNFAKEDWANSVTNTRCLKTNPGFRDFAARDYALKRHSSCVDRGAKLDWMDASTLDAAGNPRVVTRGKALDEDPNALPDIGCYENNDPFRGVLLYIR